MFDTCLQLSNLLKCKKVNISPVITHMLPLKVFHGGMETVIPMKKEMGKVVSFPKAK
ncbi:MAG: hypothetical protein GTO24_17655 [candidate division Zixibacteria bacterium]|nr:hypothetical protein [candidate division Zixibacteria bacterium]